MDCEWRMRVICISMLAFQTIGISSGEQISLYSVLDYYCQSTSWKSHYHRTHNYNNTHHRSSSHVCIQLGLYHLPLMTHVRDHWEATNAMLYTPRNYVKGKGLTQNSWSIEKTEGSGFLTTYLACPTYSSWHTTTFKTLLLSGHESSYPECFFAANLYEMRKTCGSVHELI